MKNNKDSSRKKTPWDNQQDISPLETFIKDKYKTNYIYKHSTPDDLNEIKLLNSYGLTNCKYCHSKMIIKRGKSKSGLQRYKCLECEQSFTIITNTIFMDHKLSITEWIEYTLAILNYSSINLVSKVNKNAMNTSIYWLNKIFLLLKDYLDNIELTGDVWLDETFYKVINADIDRKKDTKEYRGLSHNQYCIGIACDNKNVYAKLEGVGKTSKVKTLNTFENHIKPNSTLIHDKEKSHNGLISKLSLNNEAYKSTELKKLKDKNNPLNKVNKQCDLLKKFLNSHSGFNRENIQDYINLFCFIQNPPHNKLKKVEILLDLALNKELILKYRDLFKSKKE